MKYLAIVLAAVLTMCATSIIAEERYLCEEVSAGGVQYNTTSQQWVGTSFIVNGKYIISEPAPELWFGKNSFVVTKIGDEIPSWYCKQPFNTDGYLNCQRDLGDFTLNKNTLRFMRFYNFGYLNGIDDNDNTPAVVIGVCSPF